MNLFAIMFFFLTEKGNIDSVKLTGSEIGKHAAAKSKGLFSAEDWMCSKCVDIILSALY